MASGTVGQKRFESLVDFMLEQRGTPRRDLFEYPHRADDSRTYIANAERSAVEVLNILGLTRKPPKATR